VKWQALTKSQSQTPDVVIVPDGSVVLSQLLTDDARAFVEEHVATESWQWLGDSLAVEFRYAENLCRKSRVTQIRVSVRCAKKPTGRTTVRQT